MGGLLCFITRSSGFSGELGPDVPEGPAGWLCVSDRPAVWLEAVGGS